MSTQFSVAELQVFFLEAAAATYASGGSPNTVQQATGHHMYTYSREEADGLLYTDVYETNGNYSFGRTVIYIENKPVWVMQYQGVSNGDPEVLAFLKRALLANYKVGIFHLGRGSEFYYEESPWDEKKRIVSNPLTYTCRPTVGDPQTEFEFFDGEESISRWFDRPVAIFWHRFQGMLLRPEKERYNHPMITPAK